KAGELGGVLELVLVRLAEYQEKAQKLKNRIVAAMVYPIIVIVIAVAILIFLMAVIVPRFEAIFAEMLGDKPLPQITQFVIGISRFVQDSWLIIAIVLAVLYAGWKVFAMTVAGRRAIDRMKLFMPVFGPVQLK